MEAIRLQLLFLQLVFVLVQLAPERETLRISSYLRSPDRNASVGGVATSLHLVGLAVDLVGSETALRWIERAWKAVGLDAVDEGDHLHIELDGPLLRT